VPHPRGLGLLRVAKHEIAKMRYGSKYGDCSTLLRRHRAENQKPAKNFAGWCYLPANYLAEALLSNFLGGNLPVVRSYALDVALHAWAQALELSAACTANNGTNR